MMTSPSSDDDPAPKGRAVVRLKPKAEARAIRHGFPWVYADELVTDRRTQSLAPGALAVLAWKAGLGPPWPLLIGAFAGAALGAWLELRRE